jgi:hypothetical protein
MALFFGTRRLLRRLSRWRRRWSRRRAVKNWKRRAEFQAELVGTSRRRGRRTVEWSKSRALSSCLFPYVFANRYPSSSSFPLFICELLSQQQRSPSWRVLAQERFSPSPASFLALQRPLSSFGSRTSFVAHPFYTFHRLHHHSAPSRLFFSCLHHPYLRRPHHSKSRPKRHSRARSRCSRLARRSGQDEGAAGAGR